MEEDDSKALFQPTPLNEVVWYLGSAWGGGGLCVDGS